MLGDPMDTLWREKLTDENPDYGKVVEIPASMLEQHGPGTMLITTPLDIQTMIQQIPDGKLLTVRGLMDRLAVNAGTDTTCPMTTGIFLRIVAEVAELDRTDDNPVAPYWRVLKKGGKLNPKFPGGAVAQAKKLEEEGHEITRNEHGAPAKVANHDSSLIAI
jgi:alkylated DNA nucleotide flippase Atl1